MLVVQTEGAQIVVGLLLITSPVVQYLCETVLKNLFMIEEPSKRVPGLRINTSLGRQYQFWLNATVLDILIPKFHI